MASSSSTSSSTTAPIDVLVGLACQSGVKMGSVEPVSIPGQGWAIVAKDPLKKGDLVLQVPVSAAQSLDKVPVFITDQLPSSASTHCALALWLCLDRSPLATAWTAILPTQANILGSMPLAWPALLQDRLPFAARQVLARQRDRHARDWKAASRAFPTSITHDHFLYAWLLVNSRSFHRVTRETWCRSRADQIILQPVADLLNHACEPANGGCHVTGTGYDPPTTAFTVRADRAYAAGDQLTVSYGRHSNDTLLVHYGFTAPQNRWDETLLDELILARLSARQTETLDSHNYLANYVVDSKTVCNRTQVALRALCMPHARWIRLMSGEEDDEASQDEANRILISILRAFLVQANKAAAELYRAIRFGLAAKPAGSRRLAPEEAGQEHEAQINTVRNRWLQIAGLLHTTIKNLSA